MAVAVPVTIELAAAIFLDDYPCLVIDYTHNKILYEGGMKHIPADLKEKEIFTIALRAEENGKYIETTFYIN